MNKKLDLLPFSIFFLSIALLLNFFASTSFLKQVYAAPPDDVKGSANVVVDAVILHGNLLIGMANGSLKIYTPGGGLQSYTAPAGLSNQVNYLRPLCNSHNPSISPFLVGSDRRVYRVGSGGFMPVSAPIP